MKKIYIFLFLSFFTLTNVLAESNFEIANNVSSKTYSTSEDFLEAEGNICKSATDGCNSVMIIDGKLGAMTEMYCEDTYGKNGQEKWSCKDYDEEKINYIEYIRENISELTEEKPVLGGSWYVVDIDWKSDEEIVVEFEDGHIMKKMTLNKNDLDISEDVRICTMEYAPVCAEVQVQCIKAPCYPIMQTFGNTCMAGDNNILYTGECNSKVYRKLYKKFELRRGYIQNKLENIPTSTLEKAFELSETLIERTQLLRIANWLMEQRITKYVFLKDVIREELNNRN